MASDETREGLAWHEPGWRPDYGDPLFIAGMHRQVEALYRRVPEEEWDFEPDIDGWTG